MPAPARRAPRTLGMRLAMESEYGVTRLVATVVYEAQAADVYDAADVGKDFNPRFSENGNAAARYDGFRVAAHWNREMGLYGQSHEFVSSVGASSAHVKAMAKVMDKVDRALAARAAAGDYAHDYTTLLLQVADAIGVAYFTHRPAERAPLQRVTAAQVPDVVKQLTNA